MLERHGMRFVRYADDFFVMCRNHIQAEEALTLIRSHLENELKLKSSPERTHIATFSQGFEFFGFGISSYSRSMRDKSVENFKTKIRGITKRSHNLKGMIYDSLIVIKEISS